MEVDCVDWLIEWPRKKEGRLEIIFMLISGRWIIYPIFQERYHNPEYDILRAD
jgi:hypothetical protein